MAFSKRRAKPSALEVGDATATNIETVDEMRAEEKVDGANEMRTEATTDELRVEETGIRFGLMLSYSRNVSLSFIRRMSSGRKISVRWMFCDGVGLDLRCATWKLVLGMKSRTLRFQMILRRIILACASVVRMTWMRRLSSRKVLKVMFAS